MRPQRLTQKQLREHLSDVSPATRDTVVALRRLVVAIAPWASEAIKFGCLSYFDPDAPFRSIGGNICMIEIRKEAVRLSFIHGVALDDPHHMLLGPGKAKRFLPVNDCTPVHSPRIKNLIRSAAQRASQVD